MGLIYIGVFVQILGQSISNPRNHRTSIFAEGPRKLRKSRVTILEDPPTPPPPPSPLARPPPQTPNPKP